MKIYSYEALVIGTGAAGYNAAIRLKQFGVNVAIITEGVNCGTSRNTGSDKQTYYKLGLSGDAPDSVHKMAQNLFDGGKVDGDNALCEAALSARCFMNLCELGVPFPVNRYGEFIGYKTDHDPFERATSAGPLTSKFMTEALEKKATELKIKIFDGYKAVKILKKENSACGVLCLKGKEKVAFRSGNIIMATGGPAGIYADSVYPECHAGASGLAVLAGAKMQNLDLWQYGLASINPRWNVSGTYMQVLPRFVSVDKDGTEHEFLWDYYKDKYEGLSMVFLKGYQWPFDEKKAKNGSSVIDLLVYDECVNKKRRVYLDFTKNPFNIDFERLSEEAYSYLNRAGALFGTPIERLQKMNAPAIELYASKGVDITREYLEIALCAQHNNGGIAVDKWWQTSVKGLFAAGECAGTHGISRPGGSALNAGQVGSLRAAQFISQNPNANLCEKEFLEIAQGVKIKTHKSAAEQIEKVRRRMSDFAAAVRDKEKINAALKETLAELKTATDYGVLEVLAISGAVLTAMSGADADKTKIKEVVLTDNGFEVLARDVRPIPNEDAFFENVWRSYRENKNIY
ncbi:MAG: FAD-binding protein [Ruminococcaceae bacterium]|nr:FAD-binding protein [Oscillospiraceae bacterium]